MSNPTPPPDGGPAFPYPRLEVSRHNDFGTYYLEPSQGMTLRQWYAGQALASIAQHNVLVEEAGIAKKCAAMADAMIAELNRKTEDQP